MGIILKYILRNILEKKLRTAIVILTIAISAALLFATTSVNGTVVNMYTQTMKRNVGNADLVIRPNEDSPANHYTLNTTSEADQEDYQIGAVEGAGQYTDKNEGVVIFKILGINVDDLQKFNPFTLNQQDQLKPFDGNKVIISTNTASKYGLKIGSQLELDVNGKKQDLTVSGIAAPTGLFHEMGTDVYAVIPVDTARDFYGLQNDDVNLAYVKLKHPENKQSMIDKLSDVYTGYSVQEAISTEDINQQIGGISGIFMILTVLISILSIFIIFSSFKAISVERINMMGIFRSVGATKRTSSSLLLMEAIVYGIIGGLLSFAIGIGILYLMSYIANQAFVQGAPMSINFSPMMLLASFLMAVILSFVSAVFPIMKASKVPLKEIITGKLGNDQAEIQTKLWKSLLGVVLFALSIIMPMLWGKQHAMPVDLTSLVALFAGMILMVPLIVTLFTKVFGRLFALIFGNEGLLALKNVKGNKNILNNITLLSVAIAFLLSVNTVIGGIVSDLTDFYTNTMKFDVMTQVSKLDDSMVQSIADVPGVDKTYAEYEAMGVVVPAHNDYIGLVDGADSEKYFDYWNIAMQGDRQQLVDELGQDRNVILNSLYKDKWNVQKGDTITLKMKTGEKDYKIIGFMDTRMNDAHYALIAPKYLKEDMDLKYYSSVLIKTSDPSAVAKKLKSKLKDSTPMVMEMKQVAQQDINTNTQMFVILRLFLVLAIFVGIMSVMNNLVISFIERKRSIAMFRSVGMSKKQTIKMVFVEALSTGILGGLLGIAGGVALVSLLPSLVDALGKHIAPAYTTTVLLTSLGAGILVAVIASIGPALKSSKLNIIESVRMD